MSETHHIDVSYVAHLARLKLNTEEIALFDEQLAHIVGYIDQLSELNVDEVEPMAHAVDVVNVLREGRTR